MEESHRRLVKAGKWYMDTHLECPSCRELDRVVNVGAAYENGIASTTPHGIAITVSPGLGLAPTIMQSRSSTMSGLSQRLDPLEEKPGDSFKGTTIALAVMILIVLAGMWGKAGDARLIVGGLLVLSGAVFIVLLAKGPRESRMWSYLGARAIWASGARSYTANAMTSSMVPAGQMKPSMSRRCTSTSFRVLGSDHESIRKEDAQGTTNQWSPAQAFLLDVQLRGATSNGCWQCSLGVTGF